MRRSVRLFAALLLEEERRAEREKCDCCDIRMKVYSCAYTRCYFGICCCSFICHGVCVAQRPFPFRPGMHVLSLLLFFSGAVLMCCIGVGRYNAGGLVER